MSFNGLPLVSGTTPGTYYDGALGAANATAIANLRSSPFDTRYTTSGALNLTDRNSLVTIPSGSNGNMTLAAGTVDGQIISVKRGGLGTVSVTANIDGVSGYVLQMNKAAAPYESYDFRWDAANATWYVR